MTIVEFLLARIAEDEAVAQAAAREWMTGEIVPPSVYDDGARDVAVAFDPRRVLAGCEAKRRIVELLTYADPALGEWESDGANTAYDACMILAAVYSGHPDYDQAWEV